MNIFSVRSTDIDRHLLQIRGLVVCHLLHDRFYYCSLPTMSVPSGLYLEKSIFGHLDRLCTDPKIKPTDIHIPEEPMIKRAMAFTGSTDRFNIVLRLSCRGALYGL